MAINPIFYGQLGTCVIVEYGHLRLFVARRGDPNQWGYPGGKVDDDDESIAHAAARELEEETGIKVDPANLRPIYADENWGRMGVAFVIVDYSQVILPPAVDPVSPEGEPEMVWELHTLAYEGPFAEFNRKLHRAIARDEQAGLAEKICEIATAPSFVSQE